MSNVKIVLNRAGMHEMLRSPAVKAAIQNEANEIVGRCGEGYRASSTIGRERALASVYAESDRAKHDNYENNTILKAVR